MLARCKKCGLPDEVAAQGGRAIARWKTWQINEKANPALKAHGAGAARKERNKHGRKGVREQSDRKTRDKELVAARRKQALRSRRDAARQGNDAARNA